jgi:hypothetical protein
MKRSPFIAAIFFLTALRSLGQTAPYQNWCQEGNQPILLQGLTSITLSQVTLQSCMVNVYLTGTTTPATVFADGVGTPLGNPYAANTDGSFLFYAATSNQYDVSTTGTLLCLPLINGCPFSGVTVVTHTYTDVFVGNGGGGGGGGPTISTNGVNNGSQSLLNFVTSSANSVGLTATPVNAGGGTQAFEIGGLAYTGNAATSSRFFSSPSICTYPQFALGIGVNGNASCATPSGLTTLFNQAQPTSANASGLLVSTALSQDALQYAGATLDVKMNTANAIAITSGNGIVDTRALSGAQTSGADQITIGALPKPTVTSSSGGTLNSGTYYVSYSVTSPQIPETTSSRETVVATSGCTSNCSLVVTAPVYIGTATTWAVYVGTARWGANMNLCGSVGGTPIASNITVTATCGGKNVSTIFANGGTVGVHVIWPKYGTWTITSSLGAGYCGIMFTSLSSAEGQSSGEGRPFIIQGNGSLSLDAAVCTDPDPQGAGTAPAGYYHIDGVSVVGSTGDGYLIAPAVIQYTFDKSKFLDWHVGSHRGGPALWVYGTCCGTVIEAQVECQNTAGCIPLRVGCIASSAPCASQSGVVTNSTTFLAGSYVHPGNTPNCTTNGAGANCPNIELYAGGNNISFTGTTYLETNPIATGDVIQSGTAGQAGGPFNFDNVQIGGGTGCGYMYSFGTATNPTVLGFRIGQTRNSQCSNILKIAGVSKITSATASTLPEIIYDSNNPSYVLTPFSTLGGATTIYRCSVAGTLRAGAFTSVAGDCGTAVDTGLRTP